MGADHLPLEDAKPAVSVVRPIGVGQELRGARVSNSLNGHMTLLDEKEYTVSLGEWEVPSGTWC
jgi:hypothetical protein